MNKKDKTSFGIAEVSNSSDSTQQSEKKTQSQEKNPPKSNLWVGYELNEAAIPEEMEDFRRSLEDSVDHSLYSVDMKNLIKVNITEDFREAISSGYVKALYVSVAVPEPMAKRQAPVGPTSVIGFLSGVFLVLIINFFKDKHDRK